jgi:hypothetical protein
MAGREENPAMYPHVIQFETRFLNVSRELSLAQERREAVRAVRARRRWPRLHLRVGGATAAFA